MKNIFLSTLILLLFGIYSYAAKPIPKSFKYAGKLTPTIYYKPIYDLDEVSCALWNKKSFLDKFDNVLMKVCEEVYDNCLMQGSCILQKGKDVVLMNYHKKVDGEPKFKINDESCPYGHGTQGTCLDPFHTVAADAAKYPVGTVIYVPELDGLSLPTKEIHDGFFIVRDRGGNIKGSARFDFFMGYMTPDDPQNPFVKMRLNDKTTKLDHYLVTEPAVIAKIHKARQYPNAPLYED